MKNISFSDNKAVLNLDKNFYNEEAIRITVGAFSENLRIKLDKKSEEFIVTIEEDNDKRKERVAYHFLNYLLSEERKRNNK